MKIKKILLTASLAALASVTLVSCSGNSKTKRNTVTPYGQLNLDETFATADGDLKMTVGQYYNQLRKNGYNVVTNAITKHLYAEEFEVVKGVFENETRADFISNLGKEKLAKLECVDSGDDSKTEQGKLYDLVTDSAEANEKYLEIRRRIVKNIHTSIAGAIYGKASSKEYLKLKDDEIKEAITRYIDSVASEGIFISDTDIETPIVTSDTSYFTKDEDIIQIPDSTLAKLQQKVDELLLTQAKYLAAKKELFKIADEEYVYDEETKDDIKNTSYLFEEKTIKKKYEDTYKNYGTYNVIVIQFNSRREAMNAVDGLTFTDENVKQQYINLYNSYYSHKTPITDSSDDEFMYTINKDKNDISKLPSGIQSLIEDTLEDGEYLTIPRNIDNKYVMAYRISATYDYNTGDDSKQAEFNDFTDEEKEKLETKLKDDILNDTTSYTSTVDKQRYKDADLEIYDPYFENSFYTTYSDQYELTKTKVTSTTNEIFKIGDYSYTVEDFYNDASKKYSSTILTNYFEQEFANSYYDKFVELYLIDEDYESESKTALNDEISKFKKNKNTTYQKEIGLETYLLATYGYTNKDDVLKYYYKASKALSIYKSIKVYDAWRSAEADADGNYSVSSEARNGFLNNILNAGNAKYSDLFSINLDHFLINIDEDGDGTPDDPDTFLQDKTPEEKEDFENAVVQLARAIYTESTYSAYENSSIFDTLKFIKTQYEEGATLLSTGESWDTYKTYNGKTYNFLLTVEQLASSGNITQSSVNSFVEPFKNYVIDLYKSVSTLDTDPYKEVSTSDSSTYEYENGKYYYVNTTTKDGGFIESENDITTNTLCKTAFGYHVLLLNSYTLSNDLSYTADEASEYQKNIELILRSYVDSDEKTQNIKLFISSLNEPADGEDKCTTASFEQFFIFYVQKANGTSTSLTSSIYTLMTALFDEAISTYTGSTFQDYLLLSKLNITIVKKNEVLNDKIMPAYINKLKNTVIGYDDESDYKSWIDGSLNWDTPEIK